LMFINLPFFFAQKDYHSEAYNGNI
jgi:hypothetical protein